MPPLTGSQRKRLRGLAHDLDPVVLIGQKGLTDALLKSVDQALKTHELIKVRFNDYKEDKKELAAKIAESTQSELVGMVGHIAMFYRQNPDKDKRKIAVPKAKVSRP